MPAQRVCFQLQVKPDRIEAYREAHAAVWPDMLEALHETGWHNYSIFLRPDGLVSFEDGRVYKTLRRHLNKLGMTPNQYRTKWGLPHDYPLVAPNLSEFRSAMARQKQLGHLAKSASPSPPPKEGRRSRVAAAPGVRRRRTDAGTAHEQLQLRHVRPVRPYPSTPARPAGPAGPL